MKRHRSYFLFFFLVFIAFSCDEVIELTPNATTETPTAPTTEAELEALLLGGYASLGEAGNYGTNFWLVGELSVGWLAGETFWDWPQNPIDAIAFSRIAADNPSVYQVWQQSYQSINTANLVLKYADLAGTKQDQIIGEAHALRALVYFELIENFSNPDFEQETLGVPLVLATETTNDFPPRATRNEVYAQIVQDLEEARNRLPTTKENFRFSRPAATALLARVLLQQKRWTAAEEAATELIENATFALQTDLKEVFIQPNSALILGLRKNGDESPLQRYYETTIDVLRPHIETYTESDNRLSFFTPEGTTWRCNKWQNAADFMPLFRLAELYLIRAEARFEQGKLLEARQDINHLRVRAGNFPISEALTLARVLSERRRELAYEGHYLRDVRRRQLSPGNVPFDSPILVLPIPARALAINPNLVQNEGY